MYLILFLTLYHLVLHLVILLLYPLSYPRLPIFSIPSYLFLILDHLLSSSSSSKYFHLPSPLLLLFCSALEEAHNVPISANLRKSPTLPFPSLQPPRPSHPFSLSHYPFPSTSQTIPSLPFSSSECTRLPDSPPSPRFARRHFSQGWIREPRGRRVFLWGKD